MYPVRSGIGWVISGEEVGGGAVSFAQGKTGKTNSNTVVGHGENGNLGDGAVATLDTSGTLVDGGQVSVHVSGVTTTTWDLLTGGGDLTKGISVGGHVGENNQHVLLQLVRVELGGGEGETGSDDTLDGGVVGEVQEERDTLHGSVLLEILLEKAGSFHVDLKSGKGGVNCGKVGRGE